MKLYETIKKNLKENDWEDVLKSGGIIQVSNDEGWKYSTKYKLVDGVPYFKSREWTGNEWNKHPNQKSLEDLMSWLNANPDLKVEVSTDEEQEGKHYPEGKILREPDMERANNSVRDWYVKEYPTDDLGPEIPEQLTFNDVFEALDRHQDIYELLAPADDSVVRERVFSELADIMGTDYDYVYNQWLGESEDKHTGEKYVCVRPIKHPNMGTLIGIDEVITLGEYKNGYYSTDAGSSVTDDDLKKKFKKYNGPVYIVKADGEELIKVCSEDAAYDYADERSEWDEREFTIVNPDGKEESLYAESEKPLKEATKGKKLSSNDIFDGVRLSFICDNEPYYMYATWYDNFDFEEEVEAGNIPEDAENEEDWGAIYFDIYDNSESGNAVSGGLMVTDKDEFTPQELASELADLAGYMKVDNVKVVDSIPGEDKQGSPEEHQPNMGVTAKDLDSEGINYTVVGDDGKKMLLNFFLSSDGELEYTFYTYDGDEIDGGDMEIEEGKTWVNMEEVAQDILDFQGIKGSASMRLEDGSYEDAIDFISQNGMNESEDEYDVVGFDKGKELERLHDDGTIEYDASAVADYIDEHFDERAETLKSGDKALRWTGSFDNLLDEAFDKLYGIDLSEYDDQYWDIENEVRGYLSYRGYETIYESEPETGAEEGDLVLRIDKGMNESEDDEEDEEKEPEEDDDFDEVAWDQRHLEEISKKYDDLDKAGAFSEVIIDTPTHKKWRQPNTNLYKDVSYDENGKEISSSIGREYHEAHKVLGSMIKEADGLQQTYTIEYWPDETARDEGYGEYLDIEAISIPDAISQTKKYYYRENWESVELLAPGDNQEVLFGIYPEDGEVVYFKETEDVEVYGFNNQFNTTVKQVRVDYKNKTYKVGSFKMRNDKKLSRKDFYDKIEELEKSGFKQLKESGLGLKIMKLSDWKKSADCWYRLAEDYGVDSVTDIDTHGVTTEDIWDLYRKYQIAAGSGGKVYTKEDLAKYISDETGEDVDPNKLDLPGFEITDDKIERVKMTEAEGVGAIKNYLHCKLEDDNTGNGGTSFDGETVEDFIGDAGLSPEDSIFKLNRELKNNGIKPIREWLKDPNTYEDYKKFVDAQLKDGRAIDDPEYVTKLSPEEYENLLVNTWCKDEDELDMYEEFVLNESETLKQIKEALKIRRGKAKGVEGLNESVQNELKEVMKEANIKSINGISFKEAAEAHNKIPRGWKRIVYECKIDTSAGKAGDRYELTKNEYGEAIDKNLQTGQTYWPNWQIVRNPELAEIIEIEKE